LTLSSCDSPQGGRLQPQLLLRLVLLLLLYRQLLCVPLLHQL
jgi:hypothetical protein